MNQENKQQLLGWILFVFCALFFIASSIKNRDFLTFIGSILFLISCIVFIVPLARRIKNTESGNKESFKKAQSVDAKNRDDD